MMRADALAHSLSSRDSTSFWKDVNKITNSKVPLASKVENADMLQIHFSDLLNSVHNTDSKGFVSNHIDDVDSESYVTITASDVLNILKETNHISNCSPPDYTTSTNNDLLVSIVHIKT